MGLCRLRDRDCDLSLSPFAIEVYLPFVGPKWQRAIFLAATPREAIRLFRLELAAHPPPFLHAIKEQILRSTCALKTCDGLVLAGKGEQAVELVEGDAVLDTPRVRKAREKGREVLLPAQRGG